MEASDYITNPKKKPLLSINIYGGLVLVFAFLLPLHINIASAQIVPQLQNMISFKVSPEIPGPEEKVSISAQSYSLDLDNATISWFVNGTLAQRSVGGKDFALTTGKLGEKTKVDVAAEGVNGELATEEITFQPTQLDLLWQAQTNIPPFYQGRALPSIGSPIKVEAMPYFVDENGRVLNPDSLVYSWTVEGKPIPKASGRGRNVVTVTQIKPVSTLPVEVEVTSADSGLSNKKTVSIPIRDPEVVVYESDPLLGILFNKGINSSFPLSQQETEFIAYPFFTSFLDRNATELNYSWLLNGNSIAPGKDKGKIVVSQSGDSQGEAKISVTIQNSRDIFQKGSSEFTVTFGGNNNSSSIF